MGSSNGDRIKDLIKDNTEEIKASMEAKDITTSRINTDKITKIKTSSISSKTINFSNLISKTISLETTSMEAISMEAISMETISMETNSTTLRIRSVSSLTTSTHKLQGRRQVFTSLLNRMSHT